MNFAGEAGQAQTVQGELKNKLPDCLQTASCDGGGGGCTGPSCPTGASGSCIVGGMLVRTPGGGWPIRIVRIGARVLTRRGPHGPKRSAGDPDPSLHRVVTFRLADVEVVLLRSLAWIAAEQAVGGGTVFLNLPEMGVEEPAEVLSVGPCPDFEPVPDGADPRDWRVVTGTFRHAAGRAYDLRVDTEPEPLGVTASHPFWSHDRNDWIAAGELRIGETLRAETGFARVQSRALRAADEPVYNLEVHADHAYRVGHSGVLVHNQSPGAKPKKCRNGCPCDGSPLGYPRGPLCACQCEWVGDNLKNQLSINVGGRAYQFRRDQCRTTFAEGLVIAGTLPGDRDEYLQIKMLDIFFGPPKPPHPERGKHAGGHLIGNELGGSGDLINLVPMERVFNSNAAWRQMEKWIHGCLSEETSCKRYGHMTVTANYGRLKSAAPCRDVPTSFDVTFKLTKKDGTLIGSDSVHLRNSDDEILKRRVGDPCPGDET